MLGSLVLFLLGTCLTGSRSQQLSQVPSLSVSPGGTATLSCTLSSGFSISADRVRWYKQKLGGVPVFVYHYHTSSDHGRGQGIPDRFSVTADTTRNLWNLVITGVQREDDGEYHCSSWYSRSCHSDKPPGEPGQEPTVISTALYHTVMAEKFAKHVLYTAYARHVEGLSNAP